MGRLLLFLLIALCVFIGYQMISGALQKASKESKNRSFGASRSQGDLIGEEIEMEDHYRVVLGVSEAAGEEEIKAAYRSQLAKYHPDKVTHLGDEFYDLASSRTKDIIQAYEYLRHKYDFK